MTDCIVTEYTETDLSYENFKGGYSNTSSNTSSNNSSNENSSKFSNKNLTELESLIQILKKGIKNKEPGIKYIKYPNLLVDALNELNNLVGMNRLKDSVALQTVRLIENVKAGETSPAMLNTVLTGDPGLGKTKVGIILAKIWFALGFLSKHKVPKLKKSFFEGTSNIDSSPLLLLILGWIGTYVIQFFSFVYKKIGLFWLSFILGIFFLVLIFIYYNNENNEWVTRYFYEEANEEELKNINDRDIITVVSRDHFVGEYLGHTAGKTKKLLEENIGKVLFIDEAYSLVNDIRDAYGFECVNTLNLFLSENPDKIVVIFAGYKNQMQNSIFAAQPGLEKRCMWKMDLDPYSGEELAEIFFLQVKNEGWKIHSEDKSRIKKLISFETTFI
jgi:hypothetical protein